MFRGCFRCLPWVFFQITNMESSFGTRNSFSSRCAFLLQVKINAGWGTVWSETSFVEKMVWIRDLPCVFDSAMAVSGQSCRRWASCWFKMHIPWLGFNPSCLPQLSHNHCLCSITGWTVFPYFQMNGILQNCFSQVRSNTGMLPWYWPSPLLSS